ncbi:acyl-CoA carboxylase epsilon subunit [Streptomyces sp. NRRL F-5630]|uniref:acyl-CoA carboxylase epsilon subunit n=1 Tax=unclassified Streptomyces TaxID=2593676 RepID=UPI0004C7EFDE|nr:acyl-CoA carboxylase epsilon subunit [Streptomyces sp. NRRL F-5630]
MSEPVTVDPGLLRVEKGSAEPEELAALTAVLLARAAETAAAPTTPRSARAGWRRLERENGFHAPHSWR